MPVSSIIDLNDDGIINAGDMSVMVDHWHTDNALSDIAPPPFGDGSVNALDLIVLSEHLFEETGLMAHWPLDETEGDVAYDNAGENDAVVLGGAVWQADSGQVGGALHLDGIDDYVTADPGLNPADEEFSVFAWVKGGVPGQVVVSQDGGADWLLTDAQGLLMTQLKSGGRRNSPLYSDVVITDDQWHRIGLTWDGTNRILYVDDVEAAADTQSGLKDSDGPLQVGAGRDLDPDSLWSGMVDDVRIYNRVVGY